MSCATALEQCVNPTEAAEATAQEQWHISGIRRGHVLANGFIFCDNQWTPWVQPFMEECGVGSCDFSHI